mmetsp:Transcript_129157/g.346414  ORF Transcript_129157/g.346414 Transcript_129157/m.346414 type:complete len:184 (+) Transcript_129157:705-1256(+)
MFLLENLDKVRHHALIEVLTAQVRVAAGGDHLEHAIVNGEQADVEGATAQIVHEDVLLGLLVQTVRDGRCRRLVDDAEDVHTRDGARILRGLPLRIVEVRGHGDHCVIDLLAQVILGSLLHLRQDHGGDLLRLQVLGLSLHLHIDERLPTLVDDLERQQLHVLLYRGILEATPDQALHVEKRL